MGYLTGRATFLRFRVDGPAPELFGPEHLDTLSAHAIGTQKVAEKDGTEVGWIAGEDILDRGFDLAKNVVNDCLHFALRVDSRRLPADLLRAYAREELQALAAGNPSGRPSALQKKQARETARERLEAEALDGRYTRRKAFPLLWDRQGGQLLVGATAPNALDHVHKLFRETFGGELTLLDAGHLAGQGAELSQVRPATFVSSAAPPEVAWVKDPGGCGYLGNELLLWLWFVLETEGDVVRLRDGSEVAVMLSRTLLLECPRGQSGSETIRSEAPARLPEARRAVQAGKLPRQAGLILVRHDQQYELTLQAETLGVSGARLPALEEGDERARLDDRIGQLRHLVETLDLLYDAFLARRLQPGWGEELERMRRWLGREERGPLAAAG